jgi:hypothetical protein
VIFLLTNKYYLRDCVVFDGGQQSVSGKYSINVNENSLLLDERVVDFVAFSDRNSKGYK